MSKTVITVEDVSKSYLVGHESAQPERYKALRDVIAGETRNFVRKAADLLHGRQVIQGDEVEEFWALKNVSFEVKQGEVLGIIGRNGAGKSTLLKILSRITEPTQGRAVLRGRVASLLEVGTGFHPELTGRENIYLNGAVLGMSGADIRRKFDEIVAFADVEKFLDTPVKRYSSGMYVRLAFAIAAHLEPDILVVDEILAVGDAEFQKKCLGKMQDVSSKQGRTILFVSHNMAAVKSLCSAALLLVAGRCVAQGNTSVIVQDYLRDMSRVSATPLGAWTDRVGTGEVRFQSVSLQGPQRSAVPAFQCGEEAALQLGIENRSKRELRNVRISLGIDNDMDQRVAVLDTTLVGADISVMPRGERRVSAIIPKMMLMPGRYRLTLYMTVNGVIADWIKAAAVFDVEAGDYFGTGQLPQHGLALVLIDHRFVVDRTQFNVDAGLSATRLHQNVDTF